MTLLSSLRPTLKIKLFSSVLHPLSKQNLLAATNTTDTLLPLKHETLPISSLRTPNSPDSLSQLPSTSHPASRCYCTPNSNLLSTDRSLQNHGATGSLLYKHQNYGHMRSPANPALIQPSRGAIRRGSLTALTTRLYDIHVQ
jgi:hypothetical protein